MLELKVKKLFPESRLPTKAYEHDAGWDLYALNFQRIEHSGMDQVFFDGVVLPPQSRIKVKTGICVGIPEGYCLILKDRSGNAVKKGLQVLAGVIDQDYLGEIIVCLYNTSDEPIYLVEGDKVAQALLIPVPQVEIVEVDDLFDTERGDKGFGSSDLPRKPEPPNIVVIREDCIIAPKSNYNKTEL